MNALVTGGHGFVGTELVRQLRMAGHHATPASRQTGVDIGDRAGLVRAMAGHDVVFHVAAKAGVWGPRAEFERTNVVGTENVIAACREAGVRRLVFTSSPSVVFDGGDHVNASNDLPYPTSFLADYPRTKAEAERLVLGANGPGLATTALRPHLVYGPGDPHLLPRLIARARARRLRIVGDGRNAVSLTFVENAAAAHLQAALALTDHTARGAGRAFFVNDAEPVLLWTWLSALFERLSLPPVTRHVPVGIAYGAGAVAEWIWRGFQLAGEPPMTRFVARQLSTCHTYDLAPARAAFGFAPPVSGVDAFERTITALTAG
ncbi:3-beta hydroxysteroid dehydrogenase [Deltaproteobacteria bacterium]|nr:3-beta hydroxysteroid dehydrogenase [Deltaproteobacteria bacterium]